jgi:hypothetical protein
MICSSLNLDRFIVRLPYHDGLYTILEEFQGLRSPALPTTRAAVADDASRHCQTASPDVWGIAISVAHSRLVLH